MDSARCRSPKIGHRPQGPTSALRTTLAVAQAGRGLRRPQDCLTLLLCFARCRKTIFHTHDSVYGVLDVPGGLFVPTRSGGWGPPRSVRSIWRIKPLPFVCPFIVRMLVKEGPSIINRRTRAVWHFFSSPCIRANRHIRDYLCIDLEMRTTTES